MSESIGKLLWHKAVRKHANYAPTGYGEVIIDIPVIFEFEHPCATVQYEDIKRRIILAVCNRIFKDNRKIRKKGEEFACAEVTVVFNTSTSANALVTFKTPHLDVWQWVCNNKFNTYQ